MVIGAAASISKDPNSRLTCAPWAGTLGGMKECILDIESNIHTGKPVVVSLRTPEGAVELLHVKYSKLDTLLRLLHQKDVIFAGHYISYDFACLSENIEELRLPIWQLYQDNRVSDTYVREKLLRCA